jgi:hypothetical protein
MISNQTRHAWHTTCETEHDVYVVDDRALRRPSEDVQLKLLHLLPGRSVPVSCLHMHRMTHRPSRCRIEVSGS